MTEPTDWPHMLPCAFCGSPDVAIADDLVTFNGLCNACGASGGYSSYRNGATWLWNRRTPQPTQTQVLAVPLTDEQIKAAAPEYSVDDFLDFNAGVRFAERHHGIK